MAKKTEFDCDLIGLPTATAENAIRLRDTGIPAVSVDASRIKPACQSLSDEACDRQADTKFDTMPEVIERKAAVRSGRAWLSVRGTQNQRATAETLREYERQPDRVPRSEADGLGVWASLIVTLKSYASYSAPVVLALIGSINLYLILEILGVQVGTLTSSKETWAADRLTALAFCMAFTVSVVFSTRGYRHLVKDIDDEGLKRADQRQLFARRWAGRFVIASWSMLVVFGLFLGLLHIGDFHLVMTPLRLLLTVAGPVLLAASCCYLEIRLDHHRRRVFDSTKKRNPAKAAMHPELHANGTVEANLVAYGAVLDAIDDHVEAARQDNRLAHLAVRDDLATKANGMDEIHGMEAEDLELKARREANAMRRRHCREKLRLYDPDFNLDENDDNDQPGVAAKLG